MKEPKAEIIRSRVSRSLKTNLILVAGKQEKDYSDIVREACMDYINRYYATLHAASNHAR